MNIQQKVEILTSHPLFQVLEPKELEEVAQKAWEKTFPAHSLILNQSERIRINWQFDAQTAKEKFRLNY